MDEKRKTKISKFLSLVLRHKPEEIGLTLEENGWVKVADLLKACEDYGKPFTFGELRQVVETNDKNVLLLTKRGRKFAPIRGIQLRSKSNLKNVRRPKFFITERRKETWAKFTRAD